VFGRSPSIAPRTLSIPISPRHPYSKHRCKPPAARPYHHPRTPTTMPEDSIPIIGGPRLSTTGRIDNAPARKYFVRSRTSVRRRTADTALICSRQLPASEDVPFSEWPVTRSGISRTTSPKPTSPANTDARAPVTRTESEGLGACTDWNRRSRFSTGQSTHSRSLTLDLSLRSRLAG